MHEVRLLVTAYTALMLSVFNDFNHVLEPVMRLQLPIDLPFAYRIFRYNSWIALSLTLVRAVTRNSAFIEANTSNAWS